MKRTALLAIIATVSLATPALAHPGVDATHGALSGFLHPITGLDHVLAMVAVGLWAALLGGRAMWIVPLGFVLAMIGGSVLGFNGAEFPFVEMAIAASVVLLGAAVALNVRVPTAIAASVVALFTLAHGFAHGAELPAGASGLTYAIGFVSATLLLHLIGIALGFALMKFGRRSLPRAVGAGVMAAGAVIGLGL